MLQATSDEENVVSAQHIIKHTEPNSPPASAAQIGRNKKSVQTLAQTKNETSGVFSPYKMGISGIILHKNYGISGKTLAYINYFFNQRDLVYADILYHVPAKITSRTNHLAEVGNANFSLMQQPNSPPASAAQIGRNKARK